MITVLGIALVCGGYLAWKAYLKNKAEGKLLEERTRRQLVMSEQETRRMKILADAMTIGKTQSDQTAT